MTDTTYTREWEHVNGLLFRLPVPGGWIIKEANIMTIPGKLAGSSQPVLVNQSLAFVPDPGHEWKLEPIPADTGKQTEPHIDLNIAGRV